jgi:hypothetical protein
VPFNNDDLWSVIIHLDLSQEDEKAVQGCFDTTEKRSERLVLKCQEIINQINELEVEKTRISTEEAGILKVDVVEFSAHRTCEMQSRIDELKQKLAQLLGFERTKVYF